MVISKDQLFDNIDGYLQQEIKWRKSIKNAGRAAAALFGTFVALGGFSNLYGHEQPASGGGGSTAADQLPRSGGGSNKSDLFQKKGGRHPVQP